VPVGGTTDTHLIGRVYASFDQMPIRAHHPDAIFPKGHMKGHIK